MDVLYLGAAFWLAPWWLWKLYRERGSSAGLRQRLGLVERRPAGVRRLWVHAASVGEAAVPKRLLELFRRRHPGWEVVFSTNTGTGAGRIRDLYPGAPVFYWPADLSFCVDRALDRVRPDLVVLVEQEAWPNHLLVCQKRRIPVAIVSGRINFLSAKLLRTLSALCPEMWQAVRLCCARSGADAGRFELAGLAADRIFTTGSLKYDVLRPEVPPGEQEVLRGLFGLDSDAPLLVGGSTHPGEDEILCEVYRTLRARHGKLRLILVPRHIERAARLRRSLEERGLSVAQKTELDAGRRVPSQGDVILVDTIGDLIPCYSLASCAFVGRSLLSPGGGQNMMEPAALGKPVIVGPHCGNFRPDMELLRARGAVIVVQDAAGLLRETDRLLSDPQASRMLGQAARRAVTESRGAADRTMERLEDVMAEAGLLRPGDTRGPGKRT